MPVFSRVLIVLCGTLAMAGAASAREPEEGPLPCNTLCRHWMGMDPEAPPEESKVLPPPRTILPNSAMVSPAAVSNAADAPSKPSPPRPFLTPVVPAHAVPQRRIAVRPVPLPPRPVRDVAMPYGSLERIARVDRVIADLPVPPLTPPVEVPIVSLPAPTPASVQAVVTVTDQPAPNAEAERADATPPVAQVEPTAPAPAFQQAAANPIDDHPPVEMEAVPSQPQFGWPPPIDVIGALLMTTPPMPRKEASAL